MKLVIVESPTKAKTISHFLGKDFKIESSFGHVRDLPKTKLGVDTENNFEPQYVVPPKARKKVKLLEELAKKADQIYYATDEDREGEAIAWHLHYLICKKSKKNEAKSKRIAFHEITKEAVEEALEQPREIKKDLVDAQQARRVLDRLVGYTLSPFLWKKVMRGLSAGRVQSVAVRLVVEREEEIKKFKPQKYWTIDGIFKKDAEDEPFSTVLHKLDGKKLDKFHFEKESQVKNIEKELKEYDYAVSALTEKEVRKRPYAPYKTSTLQQDAHNKLGFSSKQTMLIAQQLYEGIEIDKISTGLITYMRTDSLNLSNKFIVQAKKYLTDNLGKEYIPDKDRFFKNKDKGAQEAHEAIRPTNVHITPESIKESLSSNQSKLYTLIWQRALASLMAEARLDQKTIEIFGEKGKKSATFRVVGSTLTFDGFLKIYPTKVSETMLPDIQEKDDLILEKLKTGKHSTEPPPRYNDASLVKELEKKGIGRPSTYAPIIDTIQRRNYVTRDESKRFQPTEIGDIVTKLLKKHFSDIVDYNFTREMEDNLDNIADGSAKWNKIIADFYKPFESNIKKKYEEVEKKDLVEEKTDKECPECKKNKMVVKLGRFGKFYACPGFPECKHTEPLENEKKQGTDGLDGDAEELPDAPDCDKCAKKMILKEGRFGKFWACPDYPQCKNTKTIVQKIDMKCPDCTTGDVVIKRTKRGKIFYGCSEYPDCEYANWKDPKGESRS